MHQVEAVLLDLGGVFYLPDHDRVLGALARLDLSVERERLDEAHYRGIAAVDDFRDGDRSVWHAYNHAYAADVRRRARRHAPRRRGAPRRVRCRRGVDPGDPRLGRSVRTLHDLGVGLAVVSNADGTVEAQLRADGICQVGPGPGVPVAVILDSSVVGVSKPEPAIFHLALDALGVAPEHALHVGDTPAADVDGAWAAGVTPVLVDPYGLHPSVECAHVASLAEVPALVQAHR